MDWQKELQNATELQPAHRRHVYRVEKYIVRVPLKADEKDYFGDTHDPHFTRLCDENLVNATRLVQEYTTIPVPKIVEHRPEMTVLERIEGVDLEEAMDRVSPRQLERIKLEVREYITELWSIPVPKDFVVGSFCITKELLFTPNRTYAHRGPFESVAEYRPHYKALWGTEPRFTDDTRTVFDHMDLFQSNIILHPNLDGIAGIIDWEYAGFIPDPRDMHVGDVPVEKYGKWDDIFDGLEMPKQ
jgi:hypothetical protein